MCSIKKVRRLRALDTLPSEKEVERVVSRASGHRAIHVSENYSRTTKPSLLAAHAFATDCESPGCQCQQRLAQQTLLRSEEPHAT